MPIDGTLKVTKYQISISRSEIFVVVAHWKCEYLSGYTIRIFYMFVSNKLVSHDRGTCEEPETTISLKNK